MEEMLKQMKAVPGVLGCMVYDDHGRLVSNAFPAFFDREMLSTAITAVSQNLPGLKEYTGGVKMIDFRFQNGRVVIRPVEGGCLVILGEGTVSLQALIISVNVAVKQIETFLKMSTPDPTPVPAVPKTASPGKLSPREMIEQGPLSASLQGMQTALAKYLGPMAKIIFIECLEKWLQEHQAVKAALPQLIDILTVEIDDSAKSAEYRQRVSAFL